MNTLLQYINRIKLQFRRNNHVVGWSMAPDEVITFFKSRSKTVLTFYGYSGMGYENEKSMLAIAQKILSEYSPENTIVNIGVTSSGIGAIYPLAKSMRFETAGIVTSLALEHPAGVAGISKEVDHICFVTDKQWGGNLPGTDQLSPTSKAMVECSDILVGIGGGRIVDDEMLAGKAQGKPIYFYPADKNHANAIRYAIKMGLPPPESFDSGSPDLFKQ